MNTIFVEYFARLYATLITSCLGAASNFVAAIARRKRVMTILVATICMSSLMSFAVPTPEELVGAPSAPDTDHVASQVQAPKSSIWASKIATNIGESIDRAIAPLKNPATSPFMQYGANLIAFFALAMTLWALLKMMMSGQGLPDLVGELVPIAMSGAIVYAILYAGGIAYIQSFMDGLVTSFTKLPLESAVDILHISLGTTFQNIDTVFATPRASGTFWSNPGEWVVGLIPTMLMKIATAFLMLLAGGAYAATALMAMLSITLVAALAPVMVPFLIFSPLSWIYDSWLKFLLGALMLKLVGAFLILITGKIMMQMGAVGAAIAADAQASTVEILVTDVVMHGTMLLIAALAALLMSQAPSIATGLLSGSAGGAGFSGIRAITQNAGTKLTAKATAPMARYAYDKTPFIGGNARARRAGAADAVNGISNKGQDFGSTRSQKEYLKSNAQGKEVQSALRAMAKPKPNP